MENEVVLKLILDKLDGLDSKFNVMEKRLDAVFEQTALLTEFKTGTEAALAEIIKTK